MDDAAEQVERLTYPYRNGDVLVLGPEIFVDQDNETINWKGVNYTPMQPGEFDRPTVQSVARVKAVPSFEELPPVPEVHVSYENQRTGIEIDVWVRADLPVDAMIDRARRALAEATCPEIAEDK